ncbi:isoamylase [Breznakiellaceae bacterium SP9]
MKHITAVMLLMLIIGKIGAIDTESYQFVDHLLTLPGPGIPHIFEDGVLFTAPSKEYGTVGISFAYEHFSKIHWFQKLVVPKDTGTMTAQELASTVPIYQDTGILFYAHTVPERENLKSLDYRLIIDGLWTRDPFNPSSRFDQATGLFLSTVSLEALTRLPMTDSIPGSLHFIYNGPSRQTITVAGTFNRWDPFMYQLIEDNRNPGRYSLTLTLPPGTYQYVFFNKGERILDLNNPNRTYTADGKAASEATVR